MGTARPDTTTPSPSNPPRPPPIAKDFVISTDEDVPIIIPFLPNIEDPDGTVSLQALTIASTPSRGTLTVNPINGAVTYVPHRDLSGRDSFRYSVVDLDGASSPVGTVSIDVIPVNDAPIDIAISGLSVNENSAGAVLGTVAVTEVDPADTHVLTVSDSRFEVVQGSLKLKDNVHLNFEVEPAIALKVTAKDSGTPSLNREEDFTVIVNNLNDAPITSKALVNQPTLEDQPFSFTVPADTFFDEDGDVLSITTSLIGGSPLPNWLRFDPQSATFSGTPANDDVGSWDVQVIARDPHLSIVRSNFRYI